MEYALIAIDNPVSSTDQLYTYQCEEGSIGIGDQVMIPFGNGNRLIRGWVFRMEKETSLDQDKLKKVKSRVGAALTKENIQLCIFMKETYLCRYYDAILCFLLSGTALIEEYLQIINPNQAMEYIKTNKRSKKQNLLLELLLEKEGLSKRDLKNKYQFDYSVMNALVKKGILEESKKEKRRNPYASLENDLTNMPVLTLEQKQALVRVRSAILQNKYEGFLIHGVTGSGKTEIYMQVIADCLLQGKTAIMLVPEIALTMQTIERFRGRFGAQSVAIIHSKLSAGQKHDEWNRMKNGEAKIVIGARSAIFSPLENIGVIIIDEEHESTYKSEHSPKYDAIELGEKRARLNSSIFLLGSATPSVTSYYKGSVGEYTILTLNQRYNANLMPRIQVADMREELKKGNRSIFSQALYDHMKQHLQRKSQMILFLNRRGYSTFVSCRACGYVVECKECGVAMTFHKENSKVVCHLCGSEHAVPSLCPECGSKYIKHFGTGTEKVEEMSKQMFPGYGIARLDLDTAKQKGSMEKILSDFKYAKTDILIGTQIIAKGLDFKNVGLVGIVAADISLNIPDFRSAERTFQLITQSSGRSGRGEIQGEVIVQTYAPEHYAIQAACHHDYQAFYKEEIFIRQAMQYPPFSDIFYIVVSGAEEERARSCIEEFCKLFLEKEGEWAEPRTLGPTPARINKIRGRYRYQLLIKCLLEKKNQCKDAVSEIRLAMSVSQYKDCYISIDINPYSFS